MYWGIILALILILIITLLWMPIELCIDTRSNQYYLRYGGLVKANVEGDEDEIIRLRLRVFWMQFKFYPLRKSKKEKKPKEIPKKKKKKVRDRIPDKRTMLRLMRSFRVKKFDVELDTGDSVLNAKLYPLYAVLPFTNIRFGINFEGRNELALVIENRPIRIIRSYINI